jgi:hypothetical protein
MIRLPGGSLRDRGLIDKAANSLSSNQSFRSCRLTGLIFQNEESSATATVGPTEMRPRADRHHRSHGAKRVAGMEPGVACLNIRGIGYALVSRAKDRSVRDAISDHRVDWPVYAPLGPVPLTWTTLSGSYGVPTNFGMGAHRSARRA